MKEEPSEFNDDDYEYPKHPSIISKKHRFRSNTTSGNDERYALCKIDSNLDCDWENIIRIIILKVKQMGH